MPCPPHVALQETFLRIGDAFCGQLNTLRTYCRPPCCFYASLPTLPVSSSSTCLKNLLPSEHICFQSHDERNCCSSVKLFPQLTLVPVRCATLDPAELRPPPLTSFRSSLLNFHFPHLVSQRGSKVRFLIIAVTAENPPQSLLIVSVDLKVEPCDSCGQGWCHRLRLMESVRGAGSWERF